MKKTEPRLKESIAYAIHILRDRADILNQEILEGTHQYGDDIRANMVVERCLTHADRLEKKLKKSK